MHKRSQSRVAPGEWDNVPQPKRKPPSWWRQYRNKRPDWFPHPEPPQDIGDGDITTPTSMSTGTSTGTRRPGSKRRGGLLRRFRR